MKKITDEMLNDYIDNQLDACSINELKQYINSDTELLNKLKAIKIVDESLRSLEVFEAPADFTNKVMNIIHKNTNAIKSKMNMFFAGIVSVFGIIIAAVFITSIVIIAKMNPPAVSYNIIDNVEDFVKKNTGILDGLFNNNQFLLAGGLAAVIVLLSTLIILDSHKNFKNKLKSY